MNEIERRTTELSELHHLHPKLRTLEEKSMMMSYLQNYYKDKNIQSNFYVMPGEIEHLALISEGIEDVDQVLVTHIDTPAYLPFFEYKALDKEQLKKERYASIGVFVFAFILVLIPFIFLARDAWGDGVFNIKDVISFFYFVFLLFFFQKYHQGFARSQNHIRNHSSVLALMNLHPYLDDNTGFAYIDKGCVDHYGLEKLLEQNMIKGKKILYLDSIGSGDADVSPLSDLMESKHYHEDSLIFAPFRFNYREASEMSEKEIAQNIVYAEEKLQEILKA